MEKTANFSAVIAKAVDEGYKLIIVLSGMHNNLRLQTQARLVEELEKPQPESCMTLTRVDEKGDFDKKQAITANRVLGSKDGFALVVLKKIPMFFDHLMTGSLNLVKRTLNPVPL